MKKGLFLLFVVLCRAAVFTVSSQEFIKTATVYQPDRIQQIEYLYNDTKELFGYFIKIQTGTAWANTERVIWEKNTLGQKTMETTSVWLSNGWTLSQEIKFVYDTDGNKTEETLSVANASKVLENSTRTQWMYEGGVLKTVKADKWQNATWAPQSLSEYSYNGNLLAQVIFSNYIASTKNTVSRAVFAYNASGQLETQTLQTKIPDSNPEIFLNETQDFYIYSEYGSEMIKSTQKWNSDLNNWEKITRLESEYDDYGNLTTQTIENFEQSWENSIQKTYTYDSGGRVMGKQYRSWIFTMWLDIFNENYVYDNNGNTQTAEFNRMFWTGTLAPAVTKFMPLSYNNSAGVVGLPQTDLLSAYKIEVTYSDPENLPISTVITPDAGMDGVTKQVLIYPNPSADGYFYFNSLEVGLLSYEVYDMYGRKIVVRNLNDGYIDLSHVPAGIYNAVLHTNTDTVVKKLIRK